MSEFVKKNVNGNEYMFINSFRGNRSGFVHETELYRNDRLIGKNKAQYYNRTWECYTYQSVMKSLVYGLMEDCREAYKNAWKNEHNVKRLTEARKAEMQENFKNDTPKNYVELEALYAML